MSLQNITCCANQTQTAQRKSYSGPTSPPSGSVKGNGSHLYKHCLRCLPYHRCRIEVSLVYGKDVLALIGSYLPIYSSDDLTLQKRWSQGLMMGVSVSRHSGSVVVEEEEAEGAATPPVGSSSMWLCCSWITWGSLRGTCRMGHEGVVTMKTGWHHNNLRSLSVVREREGERERERARML